MQRSSYPTIVLTMLLGVPMAHAQTDSSHVPRRDQGVYHMNYWIDGAIMVGASVTNYIGLSELSGQDPLSETEIMNADPNDIPAFDRGALRQDRSKFEGSKIVSDLALQIGFVAPLAILVDDHARKEWGEVLVMFYQTHAMNGNLYAWGGARYFPRYRPIVYVDDISLEEKQNRRNRHSFFSGHVSSFAASSFLTAKMLNDFHPEWSKKAKFMSYALASVPPLAMGYYRFRGGQHFPSDILVGLAVGTSMGILIPEIHRNKKKGTSLSLLPVVNEQFLGMSLTTSW